MATRVNQPGLPSADTDARVNRPSPPYFFIPSPSLTPLPPSPTSPPQHHRNMFLGDDLDTPADTSLAPSPVPQSVNFNGDESDNMRIDTDDDARDADADGDADIDADGDYIEEPDQVPVSYGPNASSSRQVRGGGQVLASESRLIYMFRLYRMRTMYVFFQSPLFAHSLNTPRRVTRVLQMMMTTTPLTVTRNMVAVAAVVVRGCQRKKKRLPSPRVRPCIRPFHLIA